MNALACLQCSLLTDTAIVLFVCCGLIIYHQQFMRIISRAYSFSLGDFTNSNMLIIETSGNGDEAWTTVLHNVSVFMKHWISLNMNTDI